VVVEKEKTVVVRFLLFVAMSAERKVVVISSIYVGGGARALVSRG